ncbi:rCG59714 [Rattus norvegicus]|uniref:RCG59714 n=1 Tax=Rattus norvegicus TaxID=10116 RepID=A6HR35_RAT|nr:rCG59714 [Rattus norvegicus]
MDLCSGSPLSFCKMELLSWLSYRTVVRTHTTVQ